MIFVNTIPNLYFGNEIWSLFILVITISNIRNLLGYIWIILFFGFNRIQNTRFFEIQKNDLFFSIFSLLFSKKGIKTAKKPKKISYTYKTTTIIVGLLFIINIAYFENLYEPKQHLSQLKKGDKFLKNQNNFPIVPLLWLNDNEIIWDVGLGCENENINLGRSYVDENIDISNCFFSRVLSISGNGGVIYVTVSSCSMNINYSMFYKCVCSNIGGAIYCSFSNSSLRMICANSCSCGKAYHGNFLYIRASQMSQVEYLSVSNCSHTTDGYYTIYFIGGNQRVDNTNSSINKAFSGSCISIDIPSSFTSSYCTFSNCNVSDGKCIYLSSSFPISISYANIVHNNSPSFGVVFANIKGSKKMMYCIFHNNQNCLFFVSQGSLEVSHSFIDHSAAFSDYNPISTSNNNSFINRITYQLKFFNSFHCNADIPLPQRTPDESPIPMITLEETIMNTLVRSLLNTLNETIHCTPEVSPIRSLKETPYSFENKPYSLFLYSTIGMFLIIVLIISYIIRSQRNQNKNDNSSSSSLEIEKKHKREEKYDDNNNDSKSNHHHNKHHHDYV